MAYRVTSLSELIAKFEASWPLESAEAWDKPGLLLGAPDQSVSKVLLTVDITQDVVREARELGADLIFAHHPFFLRGVHELNEGGFRGKIAAELIRSSIAVYCAHTNADGATDGVTETLAASLGLTDANAIDPSTGHGRYGDLEKPISLLDLARRLSKVLPATVSGVRVAGDGNMMISRLAVLAGAGDSFLGKVRDLAVDAYITSDLRHHVAQEFMEQSNLEFGKPALVDISHWAAEWLWLERLATTMSSSFPAIEFRVCEIRTDPWDFAVMQ